MPNRARPSPRTMSRRSAATNPTPPAVVHAPAPAPEPVALRAAWIVTAAVVALLPVLIDLTAKDAFRLPKSSAFRALGIALAAGIVIAIVTRLIAFRFDRRNPNHTIPLLIVAWTAIATIFSTSPLVSSYALATVVAGAALFLAVYLLAERRSIWAPAVILPGALINIAFFITQRSGVWNPLMDKVNARMVDELAIKMLRETALLGNRDDIGVCLVVPAITAAVLSTVLRGWQRIAVFLAAIALIGGVFIARVTTAIGALVVTLLVTAFLRSLKTGIVALAATAIVGLGALAIDADLRTETIGKIEFIRAGRGSSRTITTLAAARMFANHPIFGVGPDRFGWWLYDYKIAIQHEFPDRLDVEVQNFAEAHNDHVQILAETGAPGYILFLAALWALVARRGSIRAWREDEGDPRATFARRMRLPLGVALVTLMVAQFPLHLAVALADFVFIAALCQAWGADEARA